MFNIKLRRVKLRVVYLLDAIHTLCKQKLVCNNHNTSDSHSTAGQWEQTTNKMEVSFVSARIGCFFQALSEIKDLVWTKQFEVLMSQRDRIDDCMGE